MIGLGARITRAVLRATLRLIDQQSNQTVATQTAVVSPQRSTEVIELTFHPRRAGRADYSVEVDALTGELRTDNNSAALTIHVLDDKLRVLYVDHYPRYEYRYLKNALLRE